MEKINQNKLNNIEFKGKAGTDKPAEEAKHETPEQISDKDVKIKSDAETSQGKARLSMEQKDRDNEDGRMSCSLGENLLKDKSAPRFYPEDAKVIRQLVEEGKILEASKYRKKLIADGKFF